jgi:ribosomal protein S3AE
MLRTEELDTTGAYNAIVATDGDRLFQVKLLGVKLDRIRREQDRAMRKVLIDLDRLLQRPTITPDAALKAIQTKARVLEMLHKNTVGITKDIKTETALEVRRLTVLSKDKATAVKALGAVRRAASEAIDVTQLPPPSPPRVSMPPRGHKFVATIGKPKTSSQETNLVEASPT